ncbi:MAG: flippase [Thermoleophilaceae bacterium]
MRPSSWGLIPRSAAKPASAAPPTKRAASPSRSGSRTALRIPFGPLSERPLAQRVAANTAVQLAGKAAVLAIAAGSIVVLTRYLGPGDYGRYVLALTFVQLVGVLADAGLATIVVREASRDPARASALVGNALTLRLLLSFAVIAVAGLLSLALPYEPDVRVAILLAGVPLLFGMLASAIGAVFQAELRMGRVAAAEVAGRAAAFGGVIVVAALDLGFFAAIGTAGAGALVTLAVTWLAARRHAAVRFRASTATWRRLLGAGLPVGLALTINEFYIRADIVIISVFLDFDEVGLYSLAYRILEVSSLLGTAFLTSIFPVMSRHAGRSPERFRATVQGAWDVFVIVGMPVAVCGGVLAPEIVRLAGGGDFAAAAEPLRLLLAAGAIAFVNGVIGYALIAVERQRKALWLNVAGLVVNAGLNLALVPAFGIVAAAAVTLFSEAMVLVGGLWLARRHLGFVPTLAVLPSAAAAAGVTGAVLLALPWSTLAVLAPVAAGLYAGLLLSVSPRGRELAAAGLGR